MARTNTASWPSATLIKLSFIAAVLVLLFAKPCNAQKQGEALIDSLQKQLTGAKEDSAKATMLNKLGMLYSSTAPDTGIKFSSSGLALSTKLNWESGIAGAYNVLGICYLYKSDFPQSLKYWEMALAIFERQNNKRGILKIVGNIGVLYESQGNYSRALENNLIALKSAEELGDKVSAGINLGNIGADYEYLKDYQKALTYDLEALKIEEALGDTQKMANFLCNIGNNYCDQQNYAPALAYHLKALSYNEHLGNNYGIAINSDNIGIIYKETKDYDKSLEYLFKALNLSRASGIKATESKALSFIGEVLLVMDTTNESSIATPSKSLLKKYHISPGEKSSLSVAIQYLNESIGIDLETNNLNELQNNYYMLAEAQRLAGDYKQALESKEKYIAIKDSVFSAASKISIANLETKREIALKDKQLEIDKIEAAKKNNERLFFISAIVLLLIVITIVIRNMKLAAAKESSENKLNAFQSRMNPHFIFNSLSSIQSLVMNNETEASIDYLSEFSTLMRQILDTSARNKVLLKTEIEMLRSYIQLEHLRFDCFTRDISIAENIKIDSTEVPAMIIQPFVENAILHGLVPKEGTGALTIAFEQDDQHIICTVEDNGIGRVRSAELNRKRNKGRQSHGVDIATNRLTLLNNKKRGLINKVIYTDKEENGVATGTKVIIQIPVL